MRSAYPRTPKAAAKKRRVPGQAAAADWRTTDEQEIQRRVERALEEKHSIRNLDPEHPVFSTFEVKSPSGMTYRVEIRDPRERAFSCTCPDFRISGLGTCKHVESVLMWVKRRSGPALREALASGSPFPDLVPDGSTLRIERNLAKVPRSLRPMFADDGHMLGPTDEALEKLRRHPKIRISQDVDHFLDARSRAEERRRLRRDYETGVVEGRHPEHVTLHPLYPYQREGMLHLAFGERALLADEMGLGKTIQAVAACSLLHYFGKARRVLVVTPASLKAEWEEQIRKFTTLGQRLIYGSRANRASAYADPDPPFFTIVNYEQVLADSLDINARLRPDIVVLDEAQRIKNWATKTARSVKRLHSRYAFVLTGTPIENRIDELYSIVDFLDPTLLGPLFRFNREFYHFDDKGRPEEYRNLPTLRERVKPVLLRRRKHDVETELPDRADRNHFVKLTEAMWGEYEECREHVAKIVAKAKKRPLTKKESDLLMIFLAMMRMICDSPSLIKGRACRDCPKMQELARILDEGLADPDVKIIVFSEWEGMLKRVREWADANGIGYAWHTGSVPQKRRRAEIHAFREDPDCRLFLSTDSGGVGLNLQNASVVINCDLPWNPARLEQRIARAWRKHQTRPVTVINLVAENTIESAMLETLAAKMALAEGVLDGDAESMGKARLKRGREATLERLRQLLSTAPAARSAAPPERKPIPSDPVEAFATRAADALGDALIHCEETMLSGESAPVLLAVLRDSSRAAAVASIFGETAWQGDAPRLHVLDQTTWETMRQLTEAGLISFNTRATRHLAGDHPTPSKPALTPEQIKRVAELRALAAKKQKAAQVLADAGLDDEAEPHRAAAEAALREAVEMETPTSNP